MPADKQNELRRFDKLLLDAYRAFLEHEDTLLGGKVAPAVRAARFNEYVNEHFPILRTLVSPDICETYMNRFHYVTSPVDQGPDDDMTSAQRYAKSIEAYKEFRYDTGFSGSKNAEMLAFKQYVEAKYPVTLPGFSEDEAMDAINGWQAKRGRTYAMLGTVCAIALAIVSVPTLLMPATETSPAPINNNRRDRDKPVKPEQPVFPAMDAPQFQPQFQPRFQPGFEPGWQPPVFTPPPGWKPGDPWPETINWRDRLQKPDNQNGKDEGQSTQKR